MERSYCILYLYSVLSLCYGTDLNFSISGNISEAIGTNGSELVCTFLKPTDGDFFAGVSFSNQTNIVATFPNDQQPRLTNNGHYLTGRVLLKRLNNLLGSDYYQAKMIFTNLLCVDEGEYWCQVVWLNYDIGQTQTRWSSSTTVNTIALPSKPENISFYVSHLDNEFSTMSTSIPTTTETLNATSTYNDSTTTLIFIQSQTTDNYRENSEDILQAGDSLTIFCSGNVGRPPEPLLVQKIRRGGSILNIAALPNATENMIENCSYFYNSSFSTEITYKDNGAVFRCGVQSRITEQDMYIETDPIDVKYPVHKPSIEKSEGQPAESSVELFCISDGNPPPSYQWYKQDNGVMVPRESAQNITIHNVTERQIYVCKVNNTIGGVVYTNETSIVLEVQGTTTTMMSSTDVKTSASIATTKTSTGTTISNKHNDEEKKEDKLPMIIGIVVGVVLFIVILVVLIRLKRKKSNDLEQKSHENGASRDNLMNMGTRYSEGPIGVDNYNEIDIDKNSGKPSVSPATCPTPDEVRRSNEEYLKKQEEEDKKKKTDTPVEYAVVNKTAKPNEEVKQSNSYEEDHYAESPEGLYDHTHDPRHIKPSETETYDTTQKRASQGLAKGAKTESGKEKHDVGSYEDIKKVAVVGPTTRPPSGQKPANYENTKADNQDNVMKNQCHITNM